jgi:hypothetical protein
MRVDENRGTPHGGRGQFLLTGSASIMALPKLSDALVGRMALHHLLPLSVQEISHHTPSNFIDNAFAKQWTSASLPKYDPISMMIQASFPELLNLKNNAIRYEWCNGYINTLLQRDVRALMEIEKIGELPQLLRLMASRTGGLLNEGALSSDIALNHITTKKYRLLLEGLFLTLTVPAWSNNLGKRLIKSPKIYVHDLNILAYLLNIDLANLPQNNPVLLGHVLETFVAIELTKQLTFSKIHGRLYHYRTTAQQEVDFIIEGPQNHIMGIEVKANNKVDSKDFKHLETLKKERGEIFLQGLVLYQGTDVIPFGPDMWAIPIALLGFPYTSIG